MEIINELEFSHGFIALNTFSFPGDKSVKPQKDILDVVSIPTTFMTFNDFRATFIRTVESFQFGLFCR
jgi:hypothetical protein